MKSLTKILFTNLTSLELSNIKMVSIEALAFANMENLQTIDVSGNYIFSMKAI
jgi:Leucine-rich repeat (LRR) protein